SLFAPRARARAERACRSRRRARRAARVRANRASPRARRSPARARAAAPRPARAAADARSQPRVARSRRARVSRCGAAASAPVGRSRTHALAFADAEPRHLAPERGRTDVELVGGAIAAAVVAAQRRLDRLPFGFVDDLGERTAEAAAFLARVFGQ